MNWLQKHFLYFAWVIAIVAVLTSLYYGEVLKFEPCRLCWYQRIAMFPLAFLLGVAFYQNDQKIARICLPIIAMGAIFAFYHSLSQLFPSLHWMALCGESTSCTLAGPYPYLSFLAFLSMGILVLKNKF